MPSLVAGIAGSSYVVPAAAAPVFVSAPTITLAIPEKNTIMTVTDPGSWTNTPTSYEYRFELWIPGHGSGSYSATTQDWSSTASCDLGNLDDTALHHALLIRATNASGTSDEWEGHYDTQALSTTLLSGVSD